MARARRASTRGLLHPPSGPEVDAAQFAPSPALAPFVANHWVVRWDLRGRPPHGARVLTDPCTNIVLEAGSCRLVGVQRRLFKRTLFGRGSIAATKLRPGALAALMGRSALPLTDGMIPLEEGVPPDFVAEAAAVLEIEGDGPRIAALDALLCRRFGPAPDELGQVSAILARIEGDPELTQVEPLAAAVGMSPRSLQRLLAYWVGVSPKWIIRRHRLREGAERLKAGEGGNLADLAAELGYFDQAHFSKDFKATLGESPGAFVARMEAAWAARARQEGEGDEGAGGLIEGMGAGIVGPED